MGKWIIDHLEWFLAIAVASVGLVWRFHRPIAAAIKTYKLGRSAQAEAELHETTERLADGYKQATTLTERERDRARQQCEALELELAEVKKELRGCVRKLDVRDDINRQDRATIRALRGVTRRLRTCIREMRQLLAKKGIDDSEIDEVARLEEETDAA